MKYGEQKQALPAGASGLEGCSPSVNITTLSSRKQKATRRIIHVLGSYPRSGVSSHDRSMR